MCTYPQLIDPTEISLQKPGMVLQKEINVQVDHNYRLDVVFFFPSKEAMLSDVLIGGQGALDYCWRAQNGKLDNLEYEKIPLKWRLEMGLPIPIKVVVRKLPEGSLVMDTTFNSLCGGGSSFMRRSYNNKRRGVGWIYLKQGAYSIEVYNQFAQPDFKDLGTEIELGWGAGK